MTVYITIRVSKNKNSTVLLTSHAMKETWEDARLWVAGQCEHHNAGGWFVAWRISDNRSSSVETGESDRLASKGEITVMAKETTIEATTNLLERIGETTTDVYQVIARVEDAINHAQQKDLEVGGSRHYQE